MFTVIIGRIAGMRKIMVLMIMRVRGVVVVTVAVVADTRAGACVVLLTE